MLAGGGNLKPATLLKAYRTGIFPWYESHQPILWWSPNPRAVIYPDQVHLSRSLRKALRRGNYQITTDQTFAEVISGCARRGKPECGTWITADMAYAYARLHEAGFAHSVECWMDGELAGGLYGVAVGRIFCGESMFSRRADASKIAFAHLARGLQHAGFSLIDCQLGNDHLYSLGAVLIDRDRFLDLLKHNTESVSQWPGQQISARVISCP